MAQRVLKWDIPVDDEPHMAGAYPVHVMCQDTYETVQIWTLDAGDGHRDTPYQVFGTGQPVPDGAVYVGTAPALKGQLIWHIFDMTYVVPEGPEEEPTDG